MPDRWVTLDVLTEALTLPGRTLTGRRAHRIAVQEGIRHTTTRPRRYRWADIVTVARKRRNQGDT